jgi:hypothetical protein
VRRRYSEFASLRQTLVNLHPTLVIPPIPEKHTMADYAAKPTKAKEDIGIIDLRKRMLAVFLNRCRRMPEVLDDGVWWRFLDPNVSWVSISLDMYVNILARLIGLPERSIKHSTCIKHTKEYLESTSSRHSQPNASTFMAPSSSTTCQIEICTWNNAIWYSCITK